VKEKLKKCPEDGALEPAFVTAAEYASWGSARTATAVTRDSY